MAEENIAPVSGKLVTTARVGGIVLGVMVVLCLVTLWWSKAEFNRQIVELVNHSPSFMSVEEAIKAKRTASLEAAGMEVKPSDLEISAKTLEGVSRLHLLMGTDNLGRSMLARMLLGGSISLGIGLAAAFITMFIGTMWGLIAGYAGGKVDAVMMRIVDVLYGLPYILLVILLAVAIDGGMSRWETSVERSLREGEAGEVMKKYETAKKTASERRTKVAEMEDGDAKTAAMEEVVRMETEAEALNPRPWLLKTVKEHRWIVNLFSLLVAIGAVSWLTLARVVRGQVLSIKSQPFVEAARAVGCRPGWIMLKHVLPNLIGPIIVYTTLTVPQAILQESFLSFLGIGVVSPYPSWGNLASEGLKELNSVKSHSYLLIWPCVMLGLTLLALNFLGDGLRDRYDPRAGENR